MSLPRSRGVRIESVRQGGQESAGDTARGLPSGSSRVTLRGKARRPDDGAPYAVVMSVTGRLAPCLTTFADDGFDPQRPCDVSIVMPTVVRETIADALQSVFRQDLDGRIQVLI